MIIILIFLTIVFYSVRWNNKTNNQLCVIYYNNVTNENNFKLCTVYS